MKAILNQSSAKTTQSGVILITTLVFLTILTLYGVASTRDTRTQLLIAVNSQLQVLSLAAAEVTMSRVENTVACLRALVGVHNLAKGIIEHSVLQGTSSCYGGDNTNSNFLSAKDFENNVITVTLLYLTKICPKTIDGKTTHEVFKIKVVNAQGRGTKRTVQSLYQVLSKQLPCNDLGSNGQANTGRISWQEIVE